jgi:hypothetical protein
LLFVLCRIDLSRARKYKQRASGYNNRNQALFPRWENTRDANIVSATGLGLGTLEVGYSKGSSAIPAEFVANQGKQRVVLLDLENLAVAKQPAHGNKIVRE